MKKTLFIIGLVVLASCSPSTKEINQSQTSDFTYSNGINSGKLEIYRINGCQYLGSLNLCDWDVITHMGNCDNPRHYQVIHDTILIK